jgi:hypothetical protein
MHAPTDNVTPTQPVLMRFLVRLWEYRLPRAWVRARFACGIFNLGLGVLLLSLGYWRETSYCYWLGAVPLVGAALIFWTCYRLQHSALS